MYELTLHEISCGFQGVDKLINKARFPSSTLVGSTLGSEHVVVTMRNPLNSIASLLLIDGARASWTNMSLIAAVAERYERAGGEYVLSLAQQHGVSAAVMTRSSPNILILKYEAFNGRLEEAMVHIKFVCKVRSFCTEE